MWQPTTKPDCKKEADESAADPEESFRGKRWICPETRERYFEVEFVPNPDGDGYRAVEPPQWYRWVETTRPVTAESPKLFPDKS